MLTFLGAQNLVLFLRLVQILSPRRGRVISGDWLPLRFGLLRDIRLAG